MKLITKALALFLFLLLCVTGAFAQHSDILNIVKTTKFGLDKKGEETIYDSHKWFCISDNGHIFVSNGHQHNICKFTLDGKFVTKFGQKGEGPGDLYAPRNISILDNKYILVVEYPRKRRISMFDLNGKFIKIIRTNRNPFKSEALSNNYIYYLTYKYDKKIFKSFNGEKDLHIIKNILSGKETLTSEIHLSKITYDIRETAFALNQITKRLLTHSDYNGNLLISYTSSPKINVYSNESKLIKKIILKISRKKVTKKIIEIYKKKVLKKAVDTIKNTPGISDHRKKSLLREFKSMPYKKFFDEYLPYYDNFLVDKNGDIIIIINSWWSKDIWVKLYSSKDGSLMKQKKYIDKQYKFDIKKLVYSPKYGLYGFFQKRDSEDVDIRIVKLDWD